MMYDFVLDQHSQLDLYSDEFTGRHVNPLEHIDLIASQSVFNAAKKKTTLLSSLTTSS